MDNAIGVKELLGATPPKKAAIIRIALVVPLEHIHRHAAIPALRKIMSALVDGQLVAEGSTQDVLVDYVLQGRLVPAALIPAAPAGADLPDNPATPAPETSNDEA